MILSSQDISNILKNNPNKGLIEKAQEQYKLLFMHCTGEGIEDYVEDIKEFMRPGMKDTLVKLMRGNRDLIHRVMAPRDKIYTAKGGVELYNLPEETEPKFREYLSNIAYGLPVKEWVRQQLQKHYDYDPNGLVYIEISEDDKPYPAVKCIEEIFDYQLNGRAVEYVVFIVNDAQVAAYQTAGLLPPTLLKSQKVYRVVDDTTDRLVITANRISNADINIYSEIPNDFGYVPAMVISDIFGYSGPAFDSPLSPSVALLNDFMISIGTFKLAYNRQAFPKEWMQLTKCPTCNGEKTIQAEHCPECGGTGIMPYLRQSDVVAVDFRAENGKTGIPNPPMGVVAPEVEALQFMQENGMNLEDYFEYTVWQVSRVQKNGQFTAKVAGHGGNVSNTAYEAQLNEQPKHDRLKLFARWKDSIMKFIADTCGWYMFREAYDGCAILSGDRYMIESPDATLDRYTKAVAAKAPMSILDSLLVEYIENKYNNNPLLYRKFYLLIQVEPFVHEDVSVIWTDGNLPLTTRLMKKYFDEWTSTLTDYDIASVPDEGGAEILRGKLKDFVMGKYIAEKKQDNLLLTGTGEILNIGDSVQVKPGKEQKPSHAGQTYTVSAVEGDNITMQGAGMDAIFGYKVHDVTKIESNKLIAA